MYQPARSSTTARKRGKHEETLDSSDCGVKSSKQRPVNKKQSNSSSGSTPDKARSALAKHRDNAALTSANNPSEEEPHKDDGEDQEVSLAALNRPVEQVALTTRNMVIYYGKEVLCLLAILLTTMASYQG